MQSRALRVDHLAANTNPAISAAASSCIAGMVRVRCRLVWKGAFPPFTSERHGEFNARCLKPAIAREVPRPAQRSSQDGVKPSCMGAPGESCASGAMLWSRLWKRRPASRRLLGTAGADRRFGASSDRYNISTWMRPGCNQRGPVWTFTPTTCTTSCDRSTDGRFSERSNGPG